MRFKLELDNNGDWERLFIYGHDFVRMYRNPNLPLPKSGLEWLDYKLTKLDCRKARYYQKYWMCKYGPAYWIDRFQRKFNAII